uniref:Putative ribosomal protein S13/S18 n=1 Tax=uncultured marine microorganism HF4000_ANIW141C7 TaxID=455536 RepID=B3T5B1_9ZZZZ|nr:putative ribosomal protein S13/S18 [uncultured marine microorganism HF4000_ANIW141C7]
MIEARREISSLRVSLTSMPMMCASSFDCRSRCRLTSHQGTLRAYSSMVLRILSCSSSVR